MKERESGSEIGVLAFAGSLRAGSYNRGLVRAAVEIAPVGMRVEVYGLAGIPLYNYDIEERGDPEAVVAFKGAIRRADALLIATPEYQHGVPGVLKNALDWASRPHAGSVLEGKPVAILGASPGFTGTARAQEQLRQILAFSLSRVVLRPEVLVGGAGEKFDASGRLVDVPTRQFVGKLLSALAELVRVMGARRRHAERQATLLAPAGRG